MARIYQGVCLGSTDYVMLLLQAMEQLGKRR